MSGLISSRDQQSGQRLLLVVRLDEFAKPTVSTGRCAVQSRSQAARRCCLRALSADPTEPAAAFRFSTRFRHRRHFTQNEKTIKRTELIIFIRPKIIRDGIDADFVAEEVRTKLRGTIGAIGSKQTAPSTYR